MFCRQRRTKCLTAPWSCEPARVDLFTNTAFISLSAPCVYEAGFLLEDVHCTFGCRRHCCTLCTARGKEREALPCRLYLWTHCRLGARMQSGQPAPVVIQISQQRLQFCNIFVSQQHLQFSSHLQQQCLTHQDAKISQKNNQYWSASVAIFQCRKDLRYALQRHELLFWRGKFCPELLQHFICSTIVQIFSW